jgi:hypothetical protein
MGEMKSTEKKHLSQIPQTELVSQSAQHHLEHNVGWKLKEVEWGTGSLITSATTMVAAKRCIPKNGALIQCSGLAGLTMRTDHERWAGSSE